MEPRLRALCDLSVATVRESAGRHEYDGVLQDLSPDGVRRALAALGGPTVDDPYDDALLTVFEKQAQVEYGDLEMARRNPLPHVSGLDLASYDREYAPEQERAEARRRHLAGWPDAVDAAIEALDRVPAPVARGTLSAVRGLADGVDDQAALAAHARLVAHCEQLAEHGDPDASLGADALARLMGSAEGLEVDLGALAAQADAERDRLLELLRGACERVAPGRPVADVLSDLEHDHPTPDGVLDEARALTAEVIAWTAEGGLVPYDDGECLVGPAPPSRSWAMAMMSWAAPGEPEGPSWYHVTPPDTAWPQEEQEQWLAVFSRAALPAICLHEVAPGHFSHGRALRRIASEPRRTLLGGAFVEGWAHYGEEVALEEGFRDGDPLLTAGVAVEALIRVTRLRSAIGIHTGALTVEESAAMFTADAGLRGPAALSEASRATFDPTYGRYTWGKLAILALRDQARQRPGFTLGGFHRDMLALGSPPLGLLGAALA
jgi:Bacterial protein of unknown function (DUF885)